MLAFVMHVIILADLPAETIDTRLSPHFCGDTVGRLPIFVAIGPSLAIIGVSLLDALRVLLFYVSCSLVYVCLYSAIEAQSPSLAIVSYVASCGSAGCSETDIATTSLNGEKRERADCLDGGRQFDCRR